MTGQKNVDRVWFVALRHGRHNDLKRKEALHSSYIPLRRQWAAFLLSASATFSAIKMPSQMSSMIPSLGWRWLKHLLSKEWLGLQLHKFCTSFPRLQALLLTANLDSWHSHEPSATNHKVTLSQTMSHIASAWPPTMITNSRWLRRPKIDKSLCTHTMRWWVSERTGGQILNSAAIFHRCNPFCCNKIYPSTSENSENVADNIFLTTYLGQSCQKHIQKWIV